MQQYISIKKKHGYVTKKKIPRMVYSVQGLHKMKPLISVDIMNRITKKVHMYIVYRSKQQNHRHLSNKK